MAIAWRGNNSALARHPQDSVNMYFVPTVSPEGKKRYQYVLVKACYHQAFLLCSAKGTVPDYAVVVEEGAGEPCELVRKRMKLLYGFEH